MRSPLLSSLPPAVLLCATMWLVTLGATAA